MIAVIVEAALRSAALAALVWIGVAALRIRNPHIEKSIWTTVLLGALAMPALMEWALPPQIPIAAINLPDVSIRGALIRTPTRVLSALALTYTIVTSVLLVRLASAFWRVWRLWRGSSRLDASWTHGADVRIAANLSSPATFGSTILLPMDQNAWSEPKRLAVLAHERSHVRSCDCQVQWLAAIHVCIFWFSPLSWWLRKHLAKLAEHSSDDAVLRENGDRADYAAVLLEAAQTLTTARVAISIASGNVVQRIDRVLSGCRPAEIPGLWRRTFVVALLLPAVALAADVAGMTPAELSTQAQQATASNAQFGMNSTGPHIVSAGASEGLAHWYPKDAQQKGTEGLVHIAVTLDAAGRATDTLVIAEFPEGLGFGAAASGLVHGFTYANPTGRTATLDFNVKFELRKPQHPETTDFESGGQSQSSSP